MSGNKQLGGDFKVVSLHVEGVNLDKLPLSDIAAYVTDFAQMLGKDVEARFHRIKRGSLTVQAKVPREREVEVRDRAYLLRVGEAPEEAVRAKERISRRLGLHRAKKASILDSSNSKVVEIPVEAQPAVATPVPGLSRAGTLQGRIVSVRGRQDTVSVELLDVDGQIYLCRAGKELRRSLAREAFDPIVRVSGTGRWTRDDDGVWRVEEFQIASFEVLEDGSLSDAIEELRSIHSAWKQSDEAIDRIIKLRSGEDPRT